MAPLVELKKQWPWSEGHLAVTKRKQGQVSDRILDFGCPGQWCHSFYDHKQGPWPQLSWWGDTSSHLWPQTFNLTSQQMIGPRGSAVLWSWLEIFPMFHIAVRDLVTFFYEWKFELTHENTRLCLKLIRQLCFGLTMALSLNTHTMHFRHYSWLSIINI